MSEGGVVHLRVIDFIASPYASSSSDGERLFDWLHFPLNFNMLVILSFGHIEIVTSAFLNASIGQLYGSFREERIRSLLKVAGLDQQDLALLKTVVDNAKLYFKKQKEHKNEQRNKRNATD